MLDADWITPEIATNTLEKKLPQIKKNYEKWCKKNPKQARKQSKFKWYGFKEHSEYKKRILEDWDHEKEPVWATPKQNHELVKAGSSDSSDNNSKTTKKKSTTTKQRSNNSNNNSNNNNDDHVHDMNMSNMNILDTGLANLPPAIEGALPMMQLSGVQEEKEDNDRKFKAYNGNLDTLQTGMTAYQKEQSEKNLNDFKKALLTRIEIDDEQQPLLFKVVSLSDDPLRVNDRFIVSLFLNFIRADREWSVCDYGAILKSLLSNNNNNFNSWLNCKKITDLLKGNKRYIVKKFEKMCKSGLIRRFIWSNPNYNDDVHWITRTLQYLKDCRTPQLIDAVKQMAYIADDENLKIDTYESVLLSLKPGEGLKCISILRYYAARALQCCLGYPPHKAHQLPHYLNAILKVSERGDLSKITSLVLGNMPEYETQMGTLTDTLSHWRDDARKLLSRRAEYGMSCLYGALYSLNCMVNLDFDKISQNHEMYEWAINFIIVICCGLCYATFEFDIVFDVFHDWSKLCIDTPEQVLEIQSSMCFAFCYC